MWKVWKQEDPEKHTRRYYSDWLKSVKVKETVDHATGRKTLSFELDPEG